MVERCGTYLVSLWLCIILVSELVDHWVLSPQCMSSDEGEGEAGKMPPKGMTPEVAKKLQELEEHQRTFVEALRSESKEATEGKVDVPTFNRKLGANEAIDWIEALNNHFEYKGVPKDMKVKFAKCKLQGSALTWWNYVQGERVK